MYFYLGKWGKGVTSIDTDRAEINSTDASLERGKEFLKFQKSDFYFDLRCNPFLPSSHGIVVSLICLYQLIHVYIKVYMLALTT